MDEDQLLLVLTICELLDKSSSPKAVKKAYEKAERLLEKERQRSMEARPRN
jgi:hypothetical protein